MFKRKIYKMALFKTCQKGITSRINSNEFFCINLRVRTHKLTSA